MKRVLGLIWALTAMLFVTFAVHCNACLLERQQGNVLIKFLCRCTALVKGGGSLAGHDVIN